MGTKESKLQSHKSLSTLGASCSGRAMSRPCGLVPSPEEPKEEPGSHRAPGTLKKSHHLEKTRHATSASSRRAAHRCELDGESSRSRDSSNRSRQSVQGANFCQLKQWLCSLWARSCCVASCSLSSLLIRPWKVSMISCGNKAPVVGQKQCWLEAWGVGRELALPGK